MEGATEVIEALADVLDEISLRILAQKKAAAPVPAALLSALAPVGAAVGRVDEVARRLARDEYEDFPAIRAQIEEAAGAVARGGEAMLKAAHALGEGGGAAAWDAEAAAVAAVATRTTELLEIVYGAHQVRETRFHCHLLF